MIGIFRGEPATGGREDEMRAARPTAPQKVLILKRVEEVRRIRPAVAIYCQESITSNSLWMANLRLCSFP